MNCLVDCKEEVTCEDVDNNTGLYDKNIAHIGKSNAHYMSYTEATIEKSRPPWLHNRSVLKELRTRKFQEGIEGQDFRELRNSPV